MQTPDRTEITSFTTEDDIVVNILTTFDENGDETVQVSCLPQPEPVVVIWEPL